MGPAILGFSMSKLQCFLGGVSSIHKQDSKVLQGKLPTPSIRHSGEITTSGNSLNLSATILPSSRGSNRKQQGHRGVTLRRNRCRSSSNEVFPSATASSSHHKLAPSRAPNSTRSKIGSESPTAIGRSLPSSAAPASSGRHPALSSELSFPCPTRCNITSCRAFNDATLQSECTTAKMKNSSFSTSGYPPTGNCISHPGTSIPPDLERPCDTKLAARTLCFESRKKKRNPDIDCCENNCSSDECYSSNDYSNVSIAAHPAEEKIFTSQPNTDSFEGIDIGRPWDNPNQLISCEHTHNSSGNLAGTLKMNQQSCCREECRKDHVTNSDHSSARRCSCCSIYQKPHVTLLNQQLPLASFRDRSDQNDERSQNRCMVHDHIVAEPTVGTALISGRNPQNQHQQKHHHPVSLPLNIQEQTTTRSNNMQTLDLLSLRSVTAGPEMNRILDEKIKSFLRQEGFGCSTQQYWKSLYKREVELVIKPQFRHLLTFNQQHRENNCSAETLDSLPPVDSLMSYVFSYEGASINATARESVVHWMSQAVNNMRWKRSTFFVAVHAMDRYISSLLNSSCSFCQFHQSSRHQEHYCEDSPHYGRDHFLMPASMERHSNRSCDQNTASQVESCNMKTRLEAKLPLLSTAALFLGVATEEEHVQAHRAKRFVQEVPNVESIKQIFVQQLDILTSLSSGLLVTKTPEDFLYYYLGNLRASENPIYSGAYRVLAAGRTPHITTHSMIERFMDGRSISQNHWTLSVVIDWVLSMATLAYEKGGYAFLPASRLVAACLVPILAASILPELGNDRAALMQFASEIFFFPQPEALEMSLTYCLPMLREYLYQNLHGSNIEENKLKADVRRDLLIVYSTFRVPVYSDLIARNSPIASANPKNDNQQDDLEDTSTTVSGASSLASSSSTISLLSSARVYDKNDKTISDQSKEHCFLDDCGDRRPQRARLQLNDHLASTHHWLPPPPHQCCQQSSLRFKSFDKCGNNHQNSYKGPSPQQRNSRYGTRNDQRDSRRSLSSSFDEGPNSSLPSHHRKVYSRHFRPQLHRERTKQFHNMLIQLGSQHASQLVTTGSHLSTYCSPLRQGTPDMNRASIHPSCGISSTNCTQ